MKRAREILLIAFFLIAANTGFCAVASPYTVGNWPGFRTAAISYTFDDGCSNQFAVAIPMFDEFGYKLTLFTITSWTSNWTNLQNAASGNHEVASHTVTHPNLGGLTIEAQTAELANSQNTINTNVPNQQCRTIAYPYCATGNKPLCAQYYFAARGCQGFVEGNTPGDFMNISSIACGNVGSVNTAADFTTRFNSAVSLKGWCVFLIHGIDNDGGYSPLASATLRSSLEYLDARRSTFWVSTFGNVAKYAKERNTVSVTETNNTGDNITIQVTDNLDDAIYNYPLTLRRPLPASWGLGTFVSVAQNGQPVNSILEWVGMNIYITFDAVPDGGDVVISKGIYGDFTHNATITMDDFPDFLSLWLLEDCDFGPDFDPDGNCFVNFYEFALMAENWMRTS